MNRSRPAQARRGLLQFEGYVVMVGTILLAVALTSTQNQGILRTLLRKENGVLASLEDAAEAPISIKTRAIVLETVSLVEDLNLRVYNTLESRIEYHQP